VYRSRLRLNVSQEKQKPPSFFDSILVALNSKNSHDILRRKEAISPTLWAKLYEVLHRTGSTNLYSGSPTLRHSGG